MPWMKVKENDQTCVYRRSVDGKPMGKSLGCHDDEKDADKQIAALYANVEETLGMEGVLSLIADLMAPAGSYEALREELDEALKADARALFSASTKEVYVRYVFPDQALVTTYEGTEPKTKRRLWRLGWARDANGNLTFGDKTEVEERTVFQPASEQARAVIDRHLKKQKSITKEMTAEITTVRGTVISEFRGDVPGVPYANGIDANELLKGDDDPHFVVLPVGEVGKVSENRLRYDEALVNGLVAQINASRPTGILGHIKDEDRSTAYPVPDVYWVGATRVGETAWAKGYIPPGAARTREHVRIMKRVGGRIATSIYGKGRREMEDDQAEAWSVHDFELEHLDFAPYERAALQLGGAFAVTAEMIDGAAVDEHDTSAARETMHIQGETAMDRDQFLAELTAADASRLPAAVREAVIAEYETQEAAGRVAELQGELDTATAQVAELEQEREAQKTRIAELEEEAADLTGKLATHEASAFRAFVTELVAEQVKVEQLRPTVTRTVMAELGDEQDEAKARETLTAYLESDEYKGVAELMVRALGGPNAVTGGTDNRHNGTQLDDTPEKRQSARAEFGF